MEPTITRKLNLKENLQLYAKTFFGLEKVLADEVRKLGGRDVQIKNRMVSFTGDLGFIYKANLSLRTAIRILVPLFSFKVLDEEDLYRKVKSFDWSAIMNSSNTFSVKAVLVSENFTNSHYVALKTKDAIVDFFNEKENTRPDVDKYSPDLGIHVHINKEKCTISLDSSGEPLHKRGYRLETGKTPINEVLAAGLLKLADWNGKGTLLDPMCGSGTFLIEGAMMALDIPPQVNRTEFGFMKWNNYDEELYNKIYNFRLDKIKEFDGFKVVGYDISRINVRRAIKNIRNIQLEEVIEIYQRDFFETSKIDSPTMIVSNPPYGERFEEDEEFFVKIGDTLKNNYQNIRGWFILPYTDMMKQVGLKTSRKIKVFNGPLECRFVCYDVYSGSKKLKKQK